MHPCSPIPTLFKKQNFVLSQSPQNVGILGSRIPRKDLESEEGLSINGLCGSLKGYWTPSRANEATSKASDVASEAIEVASKDMEQTSDTNEALTMFY